MKIYTSYYGYLKNIPNNFLPVSISRRKPNGVNMISFPFLAPTATLLSDFKRMSNKSVEEAKKMYTSVFKQQLSQLNCNAVYQMLKSVSQGKDIVLCCYEKPDDFCHRHLVAEWFNDNEYEVSEFFCS